MEYNSSAWHRLSTARNTINCSRLKTKLIFSPLFISCQTNEGDLQYIFSDENQVYHPYLSENGSLRPVAKKSDEFSKKILPAQMKIQTSATAIYQMLLPRTFNIRRTDFFRCFCHKVL